MTEPGNCVIHGPVILKHENEYHGKKKGPVS